MPTVQEQEEFSIGPKTQILTQPLVDQIKLELCNLLETKMSRGQIKLLLPDIESAIKRGSIDWGKKYLKPVAIENV